MTGIDRRQFSRLLLSETAFAVDASGRQLGRVIHAGGGGMSIVLASPEIAGLLEKGQTVRITVMEPGTQTSHTIDAIIRFHDGERAGLEFVTGTDQP